MAYNIVARPIMCPSWDWLWLRLAARDQNRNNPIHKQGTALPERTWCINEGCKPRQIYSTTYSRILSPICRLPAMHRSGSRQLARGPRAGHWRYPAVRHGWSRREGIPWPCGDFEGHGDMAHMCCHAHAYEAGLFTSSPQLSYAIPFQLDRLGGPNDSEFLLYQLLLCSFGLSIARPLKF